MLTCGTAVSSACGMTRRRGTLNEKPKYDTSKAVLGVNASELLSVLENGGGSASAPKRPGRRKEGESNRRANEIQKLLMRFKHQRAAMDRTKTVLEDLMVADAVVVNFAYFADEETAIQ
jgi:hypothetical protein